MRALRYSLVAFAVIAALAGSIVLVVRALQNVSSQRDSGIASPESSVSEAPGTGPAQDKPMDRAFAPLALPPAGEIGTELPADRSAGSEPAASRLQLSPQQQDKVRYVLLSHNIMQSPAAAFPLQIGGVVPQNVALTPLPREVADAVPNYRAYSYVISQDRIAIVVNERREIGFLIPI